MAMTRHITTEKQRTTSIRCLTKFIKHQRNFIKNRATQEEMFNAKKKLGELKYNKREYRKKILKGGAHES